MTPSMLEYEQAFHRVHKPKAQRQTSGFSANDEACTFATYQLPVAPVRLLARKTGRAVVAGIVCCESRFCVVAWTRASRKTVACGSSTGSWVSDERQEAAGFPSPAECHKDTMDGRKMVYRYRLTK